MDDLAEGTLADLSTLMHHPPRMRRGHSIDIAVPAPAAGGGYTYKIGQGYWERIVCLAFLLTTGSAAGARAVAVNYCQGDGTVFNSSPAATGIGPSQTCQVYGDLEGTPSVPPAPAQAVTAAFAAGVAGTVTLPAGAELLGWTVTTASTAAAENGTITVSNVPGGPLLYNFTSPNGGNGMAVASENYPAPLPSTGTPITVAISAITSGAAGNITAYYTEGGSSTAVIAYPQLPDLVMKSGWSVVIAVTGVQAADQLSSIVVITEQYASNWADGSLGQDEERHIRWLLERLAGGS